MGWEEAMNKTMDVVVGAPIHRRGAYIIDKFLSNQKEIQQNYPSSELILATVEDDFIAELESLLSSLGNTGKVILYETVKPDYAHNIIWNITCGREAIRQYVLSQTEAKYLLFLDSDMTFHPSVIEIMKKEIQGYDVVHSGYALRHHFGVGLNGLGCSMLTRDILEKIRFRCCEFRNGEVVDEGSMLEMDLVRLRGRIKRGIFVSICHYENESEARSIDPQPLGLFQRMTNHSLVRYALIRTNITLRRDITSRLKSLLYRFRRPWIRLLSKG